MPSRANHKGQKAQHRPRMLRRLLAALGTIAVSFAGGFAVNAAWQSFERPSLRLAHAEGVQVFATRTDSGLVEVTSKLRDLKTGETAITTAMYGPDTVIQSIAPASTYYVKLLLLNPGRSSLHNLRIPLFANVRGTPEVSASGNVPASLEASGGDNTIMVPTLQPRSTSVVNYVLRLDSAQGLPQRVWIKVPYVSSDELGVTLFPDTLVRLAVAFRAEKRINPSGALFTTFEAIFTGKRGPLVHGTMKLVPAYFARPAGSEW